MNICYLPLLCPYNNYYLDVDWFHYVVCFLYGFCFLFVRAWIIWMWIDFVCEYDVYRTDRMLCGVVYDVEFFDIWILLYNLIKGM